MLPIPLSVSLVTSRQKVHVTKDLADFSFRTTAPGGFASARITLHRPLSFEPDEIALYGKLYIHDARNRRVVWEGRLEDPGRSSTNGEVYEIAAVGPSAHTRDRTLSIHYVGQAENLWGRAAGTISGLDTTQLDLNAEGWKLQIRNGTVVTGTVPGTVQGGIQYTPIKEAGQVSVARISLSYDMGNSDTDWRLRLHVAGGFGFGGTQVVDIPFTTTAASGSWVITTDFTADHNSMKIQIYRTSNVTVTDDTTYAIVYDITVRSTMYAAAGGEITTAANYASDTISATEVVADLLGRLLTQYDGANASIATTTYGIETLYYTDPVNAERILADLALLEPAFFWEALESNAAGKYRFNYRQWPTNIRYEADITDGYDSTGSSNELYNEVRVRYRTASDLVAIATRTQSVPALSAEGLTRSTTLDLGQDAASQANAEQAGDKFLLEHQYPLNAGRLTIARPILDIDGGRMVMPWEIRPGYLIRVRGIAAKPGNLNATTRDGLTIFRIVSVEYSAAGVAVLELDTYSNTEARALADLQKRFYVGPPGLQIRRR